VPFIAVFNSRNLSRFPHIVCESSGWRVGWENAMAHQYKSGDVVTVFQISANELVIEGKATIRTRVAEVDEYYRVEFADKPGVTYQRFVDSWGQNDPQRYVRNFNRRFNRRFAR
jgi:hypothetical protein